MAPSHSSLADDALAIAGGKLPAPARPRDAPSPAAALRPHPIVGHLALLGRGLARRDAAFVLALLAADLVFLAMFAGYAYAEHYRIAASPFYGNANFSFIDGGYPERYGYAKQALIAILMVAIFRRRRQPVYPALALLFATVLLDDSLALHEGLGATLAAATGISSSAAELAGWSILGLLPLAVVFAAWRRSDARGRRDAEAVLAGFATLLFFAVGMDQVHGLVQRHVGHYQTLLTIVEDGGELVTFTVLIALSLGIRRLPPPAAH